MRKFNITVIALFLSCFYSINAQNNIDSYMTKYEKYKEFALKHYLKSQAPKTASQKTFSFTEAYYDLSFNFSATRWDTNFRVTVFTDSIAQHQILISERYTPQGYVLNDSTNFYFNTTFDYFKVYGKELLPDSATAYLLDSATNNWNVALKELNIPNSNGDLDKSETLVDFSLIFNGIPGTLQLVNRLTATYNLTNELQEIVTLGLDVISGLTIRDDSIICSPNANGYRSLDSIYNWNDSIGQWVWSGERLYNYDGRDNLISDEIDQESLRRTSWDVNDRILTDSSFSYFGSAYSLTTFKEFSYNSNGLDSIVEYSIIGGFNSILRITSHHYSLSGLDSIVEFGYSSFPMIANGMKESYVRQPFITGINDYEESIESFQLYPNPSNGIIQISSKVEDVDVQVFDLNGKEFYRFSERGDFTIDLSELSSGLYLLKLNGQVQKFLIEK